MSNISPECAILVNADDYGGLKGEFIAKIHALSILAGHVVVYTAKHPDQCAAFAPLVKKGNDIDVVAQDGLLLDLQNGEFASLDTVSYMGGYNPTAPTPEEKAVDFALARCGT